MKILVVGLGAIGSIYATRFKEFGHEVKVLVDDKRLCRYRRDGIYFNDVKYDFDYILPSDSEFKPELIIIAVKYPAFKKVLKDLKNFVDNGVIILSLLNGISTEKILREEYLKAKILKSYYVGHASMRDKNRITYDGIGKIVLERDDKLEELFNECEINYEFAKDIDSSMWQKFIINIGVNQTTAVLKKPYKCFETCWARNIARGLMQEGVCIAKAEGILGTDEFINNTFKLIDDMPKDCKTSMMQDIENGQQTEVDIFAGTVIELGKKLGVLTPLNEFVYNVIKGMEEDFSKCKDL